MEQQDGARVSNAYLRFAEEEVRDKSPLYDELLRGVAADPEIIEFLLTLPREKRQPNLFSLPRDICSARQAAGISFGAAFCRTRTFCEPLCWRVRPRRMSPGDAPPWQAGTG